MISPEYLKPGDKIGVVSTARKIAEEEIQHSIRTLNEWGFEIVLGNNLFNADHQFAGTDEERKDDLQAMLDDPTIKAILCARGGYGTTRIIDQLDFTVFTNKPKWIIGYSDITVLHSHIQTNFNIETIHAMMCINFSENNTSNKAEESLKKALLGKQISYGISAHPLNRQAVAEGLLVGGNLSILYSLRRTSSDIETGSKVLFIEDVDEYLYHIDRMMMNLKRSGLLKNLAGLIVGGMTDMNDNDPPTGGFGKTAEEIIAEAVAEYDYPVCYGFPAGHIDNNFSLIMGRNVKLTVEKESCELMFNDK